jgi:hypothetical protein
VASSLQWRYIMRGSQSADDHKVPVLQASTCKQNGDRFSATLRDWHVERLGTGPVACCRVAFGNHAMAIVMLLVHGFTWYSPSQQSHCLGGPPSAGL